MSTKKRATLMGILNATPNSFFDKGAYFSLEKGLAHGMNLAAQGADLLDIGGASSHPHAPTISVEEELERVIPLIQALSSQLSIPLSIDTSHVEVAQRAVENGVSWINDVNGFSSTPLLEFAASCGAKLCLMHRRTQDSNPSSFNPDAVISEIMHFFDRQLCRLTAYGVNRANIVLDPGIGFGKTKDYHMAIFQKFELLKQFGLPLLVSASRKGSMAQVLGKPPHALLPPTLAAHALLFAKGADLFRVHDVAAHRDALDFVSHFAFP